MQSSESQEKLSARRAERELREEKERALRLERELEAWKALRVEKGALGLRNISGSWRPGSAYGNGSLSSGGCFLACILCSCIYSLLVGWWAGW